MSAHLIQSAVLSDRAILADIEVITYVDKATLHMVVLQLLWSIITVLTRGRAVNNEIADRVRAHKHTVFHVSEEFVLGGDLVATDGKRKCFLDHRLLRLIMLIQSCHARGDAEKTCNRCDDGHHSVEDFLSCGLSFKKFHFFKLKN